MANNYKQQSLLTEQLEGYDGKKLIIDLRSGYEIKAVKMIQQLIKLKKLKSWSSEESVFNYIYDLDNKNHRYFMDFTIVTNDDRVIFVEVKPLSETKQPRKSKKVMTTKKQFNYEKQVATYIKNQNKWKAVKEWCNQQNKNLGEKKYSFTIWTEKELSIK